MWIYGKERGELRSAPVTSADQPRDNCTPRTYDLLPRFTISSGSTSRRRGKIRYYFDPIASNKWVDMDMYIYHLESPDRNFKKGFFYT